MSFWSAHCDQTGVDCHNLSLLLRKGKVVAAENGDGITVLKWNLKEIQIEYREQVYEELLQFSHSTLISRPVKAPLLTTTCVQQLKSSLVSGRIVD